ncbi:J domain-containing protein [Meloidogyne graminicola]|uniref:J domain-containing protein n=1 Tax=Meloidogyne graminicola TaxID=189291 RepID=A0A8S9Z9X2_9BILA|nr:J domain-containing protein [Meloidogyne graminicola]
MVGHRKEYNYTDKEILSMMLELKVTHSITLDELRKAFFKQIKAHHSDKGGAVQKAQIITQAYRVLKQYLEAGIMLPKTTPNGFHQPSTSADFGGRSGCRPSQQAHRSAPDGFEDFGDFQDVKSRRKKRFGGMNADNNQENGSFGEENSTEGKARNINIKSQKFVNGYTYSKEDFSTYDDPMERPDRQKDGVRKIRGGLLLYKDFNRALVLPPEYQELGNTFDENDLVDDPIFSPILEKLQKGAYDLPSLAEKLRIFIYIAWAFDGGAMQDAKIMLQKVKMEPFVTDDDSLYEIKISRRTFDDEVLTPGLHVEVRSVSDPRLYANAVIEQVVASNQSIVLFFVDPLRLSRILALSNLVNVSINSSAFVYRSQLRSLESILANCGSRRNMDQIIYPKPEFTETFEEFRKRRATELLSMPFRDEADHSYNEEQKNAIFSIVNKEHHPWPFVLFGPPGTGKTITLVESVRHLVLQSSQNRILVCTPSKMAADNFAEVLLQHDCLEHKYIFRMHSLCLKEAKHRFFGIPDRLNLKMFRVIISTLATSSYLILAGGLRDYFTHIIVDEAGQALESEAWIPIGGLVGSQTSVVLAGDPMQLGPVLNVNTMKWFGFDISMLKRVMHSEIYKDNPDDRYFVTLCQTYRSHYNILRPCSYLFYDNLLIVDDRQGNFYKLSDWEGLPTKGFPIIFHSSRGSEDEVGVNRSHQNTFEANLVCKYVQRILTETNTKEKDIGVISPYKNQVLRLRLMLATYPGVTVDSVEGFQGSEREVIIMSMVRQYDLGFLRCDLRLNTSISRAKYMLIIIGNEALLSQHTTWKKFIYYCRFHGGFLNSSGEKMEPIADEEELNNEQKEEEGEEEKNYECVFEDYDNEEYIHQNNSD